MLNANNITKSGLKWIDPEREWSSLKYHKEELDSL